MNRVQVASRSSGSRGGPRPATLKLAALDLRTALVSLLLASCLVFGGATRANAYLVAGLCLLALITFAVVGPGRAAPLVRSLLLCALGVLIATPIVQLAPLPVSFLGDGGLRGLAFEISRAAGARPAWAPISLAPNQTIACLLALLPPLVIFASGIGLSIQQRRLCVIVVLAAVLVSLAIGGMQIAGGSLSPAYFYSQTNADSLVGFFANRNHQASFLLVSLPLATALAVHDFRVNSRPGLTTWLAGAVAILAVTGLAVVRSRTGLALLFPTVVASAALAWRSGPRLRITAPLLAGGAFLFGLIALIMFLSLDKIILRFADNLGEDLRFQIAPVIWKAANDHLPFGSGIGTFEQVYRSIEPTALMLPEYVNHAHNDYLELWLEAGVAAAAGVVVFVSWFAAATYMVWRSPTADAFSRAASIVIGILLLHSGLDYPLRTAALSGIFAFSCALLATPQHFEPAVARRRRRAT